MPDWYSWTDLLHRWNKKDFELLEYLKQGLQPYSKYGEPVYCPQSCLPEKMAEKLPSVYNGSTINFGWRFFTMPSSDDEMGKLISLLKTTRFKRDNVLEIEKKTGLNEQTKIPLKWLNGCQLMEMWGLDAFELSKLIFESHLPAYDVKTLRSIRTNLEPHEAEGENQLTRGDFGNIAFASSEVQMDFMARIRFKPFEVEKWEKENEERFNELKLARAPSKETDISKESPSSETSDDQIPKNYFRNRGDYWEVMFAGKEVQLRNLKRLHYIIHLLERPNKDTGVDKLDELVNKSDVSAKSEDEIYEAYDGMTEEQLTEEGLGIDDSHETGISQEELERLENRMEHCIKDLDFVIKRGKPEEIKEKQLEKKLFIKHCRNNYGIFFFQNKIGELKYEIKKRPKKEIDTTRLNIKTNIVNVIKDLEDKHKSFAKHIDRYIVTGVICTYLPPDGVLWDISWKP